LATFRLNLLGEFELRDPNGQPVSLSSGKARALLACLALAPDRSVSRAKIATLLWGDRGEAQARGSLRQTLSVLRKALDDKTGSVLLSSADGISLNGAWVRTDLAAFEAHATSGQRDDLERAAALYRGTLLDGFGLREAAFEDWLRAERRRLADLAGQAMSTLAAMRERDGEIEAALSLAERLVKIDPLQEEACRLAMRLHQQGGNRNEALRYYRECESVLASELGVAPQEETKALYEEILAGRDRVAPQPGGSTQRPRPVDDRPQADTRQDHDGPSIAVLPFSELAAGATRGGLGDAFPQDIIVELSRRRWLTVIARGSTFQFDAGTADLAHLRRVLNAGYVLTGSSHVEGGRLRVTAELADCNTGHVLWADGFERPYADVFSVRRAVSEQVAASVSQEIERAEIIRTRDLEPGDLGAWACYPSRAVACIPVQRRRQRDGAAFVRNGGRG
jgi:DNA-binding SARP family transcriptional activator